MIHTEYSSDAKRQSLSNTFKYQAFFCLFHLEDRLHKFAETPVKYPLQLFAMYRHLSPNNSAGNTPTPETTNAALAN